MPFKWYMHETTGGAERDAVKRLGSQLPRLHLLVREAVQNSLDASLANGKPVRVEIELKTLRGEAKANFLTRMMADSYRAQALASQRYDAELARKQGDTRINADVIRDRNIDALNPGHDAPLRLLIIRDFNAAGLTGAEMDNFATSRFSACCSDAEFSVKRHRDSGGSFGKGKNVLWWHAGSRMVLFYSHLSEPWQEGEKKVAVRFIGVGKLPFHASEQYARTGRYSGRCEFGEGVEGGPGVKAIENEAAKQLAGDLGLARSSDEPGTTICIVDFDAHSGEDGGANPVSQIKQGLELYYWPAMIMEKLKCTVIDGDSEQSFPASPRERDELAEYISAFDKARAGSTSAEARVWTMSVPKRDSTWPDSCASQVSVACALLDQGRVDQIGEDRLDRVALIRGFGMVVEYRKVRARSLSGLRHISVCLAGCMAPGAGRSSGGDQPTHAERLETLLASAEPEAHDSWDAAMLDRFDGWRGSKAAINDLHQAIKTAVQEIVGKGANRTGGGIVRLLASRFPLGKNPSGSTKRAMSVQRREGPSAVEGVISWQVNFEPLAKEGCPVPEKIHVKFKAGILDVNDPDRPPTRLEIDRVEVLGSDGKVVAAGVRAGGKTQGGEWRVEGIQDLEWPIRVRVTSVKIDASVAERTHAQLYAGVEPVAPALKPTGGHKP